jgi:hypothetical protein
MTAPSKLPIQPGTLCWLRHPTAKQNVGKIVEVLRLAGWENTGSKVWCVKSRTPVLVCLGNNSRLTVWPAGQEFLSPEAWLVPIAGPGLVDEVEQFDANSQPETLGQLLRDAGLPVRTPATSVRR